MHVHSAAKKLGCKSVPLPRWARWLLASDPQLASRALAVTLRAIFAHYRRGTKAGRCGAVTFVQRFGSALNLNVHFHCVIPDGVFLRDGSLLAARALREEDVETVLLRIVRRLQRLLRPHRPESGNGLDAMDVGYAQSIQSLPRALLDVPRRRRCSAFTEGFSLHASVHLHANDREGLERLCRYGARGPLSLDRLWQVEDGRVCYRMKRPLPDGRCELLLAPTELLRRLAALVPPPRRHLVRFHDVFGPNSSWRAAVVPRPEASLPLEVPESRSPAGWRPERQGEGATRLPWAELFKRVWRTDVLRCERWGGQMRVLAFVTERPAIRKMLDCLGLPSTGPPIARARRPAEFDFAG